MAKKIIILETAKGPGGDLALSVAFWLPVAAGQEVPIAGAASAYRGATAGEVAALAAGSVVEQVLSTQVPAGTSAAQIKAGLVTEYNARATALAARQNPNAYYGTFWDGSVWSA